MNCQSGDAQVDHSQGSKPDRTEVEGIQGECYGTTNFNPTNHKPPSKREYPRSHTGCHRGSFSTLFMKLNEDLQTLMYKQNMDAHHSVLHSLGGLPRACMEAVRHFSYENDKRMTAVLMPVRGVAKPRTGRARVKMNLNLAAA